MPWSVAFPNFPKSSLAASLFLFIGFFSGGCNPDQTVDPVASDGIMDARQQNLDRSPLALVGNWNFAWNQWVDPANPPSSESGQIQIVPVPSHWTDYKPSQKTPGVDAGYPERGKASFWLFLRLDPNIEKIALRLPAMDTAFVLFWNGNEVARNGYLNVELGGSRPVYYAPRTLRLNARAENTLVLHMANDVYPRPGLRDTILLGSESLIARIAEENNFFAAFLVGALALMALYHLGMYAMRREDRSPLYFSLFCILIVIRLMVTGEGQAFRFFPINWHISTALEYLTYYLAPVPFLLFLHSLYPRERIPYLSEGIYALCAAFAIVVLALPIGIYTRSLIFFQAVTALTMIYGLGIIIVAVARNRDTARSFLVGILFLAATLINDILFSLRMIESTFLVPFGVFLFFFSQAFLLSRRFAIAFRTAETLTRELDEKVQQRTLDLEKARDRSDELLRNILPQAVATELREKGQVQPQYHAMVTVLFVDFVDFTRISERWHPNELVTELHKCFSAFDEITHRNQLEKLKTIGDSYMAAAGIPESRPDHAYLACEAALEIAAWMQAYRSRMELAHRQVWNFRIGLHSGPVTAGVIGTYKFAYDIWGDTVNTASRMERFSAPGQINISEKTYELVLDHYACEERSSVDVPGKGMMKMYSLNRRTS